MSSEVAGSAEGPAPEGAPARAETFEIQEAAAAAPAAAEPYDAVEWMQPAAAMWLRTPSSRLARCYMTIGPRLWSIATTAAMAVTVLGEGTHPGYKFMASIVNIFELWDYFFHKTVATRLRFVRPFWVGRQGGTEVVELNTRVIAKWLCVGTGLMVLNLLVPAAYTWKKEQGDHERTIILLIASAVKLAFLPVIVQPHIATTLMMELDMHHLSESREHQTARSLPDYVRLVGIVKTKWRSFLHYHFGQEIIPPLMYIFAMILLVVGLKPHPEVLLTVSAAPLSMAYLWLQVLPLARFNQMIVDWQLSAEDNDMFRILWQKERALMFTVFRYRITFRKMRLSILSLALSMLIKQGRTLVTVIAAAFDEMEATTATMTSTLVFN